MLLPDVKQSIAYYQRIIDYLKDEISNTTIGVIVAGNCNDRVLEWSMPLTNTRGSCILEIVARTYLGILIVGNTFYCENTFNFPGYGDTIQYKSLSHTTVMPLGSPTCAYLRIILLATKWPSFSGFTQLQHIVMNHNNRLMSTDGILPVCTVTLSVSLWRP